MVNSSAIISAADTTWRSSVTRRSFNVTPPAVRSFRAADFELASPVFTTRSGGTWRVGRKKRTHYTGDGRNLPYEGIPNNCQASYRRQRGIVDQHHFASTRWCAGLLTAPGSQYEVKSKICIRTTRPLQLLDLVPNRDEPWQSGQGQERHSIVHRRIKAPSPAMPAAAPLRHEPAAQPAKDRRITKKNNS